MAYIAPIHRPSSVRHAIRLSFLAPDSEDIILAKAGQLEIWTTNPQAPDQLTLHHTKHVYGKVTLFQRLRPAASPTDHLFVCTDRYHYFTLSWDAERKEPKTEKSYVDFGERSSRDNQTGDRAHIDPSNRFMTLECYEGIINVLPLSQPSKGKRRAADNEIGELGQAIPVRIEELFVKSTCFLHDRQANTKPSNPRLAILEEDIQQNLHVKVRELEYTASLRPQEEPDTAELEKKREVDGGIELGASHLIPLPAPIYGFFIVGETGIAYVDDIDYRVLQSKPLAEATVFVCWCAIDDQRFVLADDYGQLYLLYAQLDANESYIDHRIDKLGETSRASVLVYLDGGRIFVGSNQGDSQIIRIVPQGLEVVQTFPNVAPILDFTVMDMGNRAAEGVVNEFSSGQARIVTGSGAFKDGSLRSVRSGVGLEDVGTIGEMGAPISTLFGLSSDATGPADTLLVSLVDSTRIFKFDAEGQVEETDEFAGFDLGEATIVAGTVHPDKLVQVTGSKIVVSKCDGGVVLNRQEWTAPTGTTITSAQIDEHRILLSLQGAVLILLTIDDNGIHEQARRGFSENDQISCIALNQSLLPDCCIVGFWQSGEVAILELTDLRTLHSLRVSDTEASVIPRSLILARIFDNQPLTLFVGLADGNVVSYTINRQAAIPFDSRKSMILGTQQPQFTLLPRADGLQNVFAICEHSSLVYGSEGRMVYSAVTAEDATSICSFDSEAYPGAIVIATAQTGELKLAFVDEERTTHVETLPVKETVRRIAYSPALKAFGLGTIKRTLTAGAEEIVSHFKLVDEIVFQELASYRLEEDELIENVMRCELQDAAGMPVERFVVGSGFLDDEGKNGVRGRLLIFEITQDRQLQLILAHPLKGACRCLAMCEGRIVAALIKTIVTFTLEYIHGEPMLEKTAAYRTATAPIDITVTNDMIAVTDLMKSLSLIKLIPGRAGTADTLSELARHYETLWGTAVANVADNTYLEADAEGNLVVLQHELESYSEQEKRRLRVTSEMLLGEMVNRIRRINVQPSPGAVVVPRAFLATVEGSLYMFALIAPGKQDLLMRMQTKMATVVKSLGNVPFSAYRGFKTTVRDMGMDGPVRFVDGVLIEEFIDCDEKTQLEVVNELGADLEDIRTMVETLRRTH